MHIEIVVYDRFTNLTLDIPYIHRMPDGMQILLSSAEGSGVQW